MVPEVSSAAQNAEDGQETETSLWRFPSMRVGRDQAPVAKRR